MSKIRQYINIHRKSRKEFMSIADFNRKFKASLPENAGVEKAFHNDVRKKRHVAFPVRGNLYDIEAKLGLAKREARRTLATGPRSITVKNRKKCGCRSECDHDVLEQKSLPVSMRPAMRRSNMKLRIRSAKRAVSMKTPEAPAAVPQSELMPEELSAPHELDNTLREAAAPMVNTSHMGHKRYHKHGKHKESEQNDYLGRVGHDIES